MSHSIDDMKSTMNQHKMPGEHLYKGIPFNRYNPLELLEYVYNMPMYEDDILVAAYPKSGTTWIQEIVWLVMNDVNTEKADQMHTLRRIPYIENCLVDIMTIESCIKKIESLERPRVIRTHLPYDLAPKEATLKKAKIVVVLRNPKDVLMSFYHFYRMNANLGSFTGSFGEFYDMFMSDQVFNGSWFDHVLSWWERRNDLNILFVKYEEMKKDPKGILIQVANFLGKELSSEQVNAILTYTRFENMRENKGTSTSIIPVFDESISKFYRKGEVGDWKNHFTVSQNEQFDKVYSDKISGSGLVFDFD